MKILSRLSAILLLSLAFSAHGQVSINSGDLYGIDVDGNQLIRYDASTGAVLESVGLPARTYVGLTITDGRVFAAVVNGEIYEVDPQTGSTTLLFSSSASENLGRYGSNLIFVNFGSGVFTETQTDGTTVRTGSLDTGLTGLEGDAQAQRIYGAGYSGAFSGDIAIYDGTTLANLGRIETNFPGNAISAFSYDPATDQFWVATGFGDDRIYRFDATGTALGDFPASATWINALSFASGAGGQPAVSLSASSVSIQAEYGGEAFGVVTVTNSGSASLDISDISGLTSPFELSGGSCLPTPTALTPGNSCTIEIRFAAGGDIGNFSDSFSVTSNAATSPDVVDVQGTSGAPISVPALNSLGMLMMTVLLLVLSGWVLRRQA